MKLSIETNISKKIGTVEAFRIIKEHGFDCIDFSFYSYDDDHPLFGDDFRACAKELRAELDSIGLECNQAHAPMCFVYGGEFNETNRNWLKIARSAEAAAILGAKAIIVHAVGLPLEKKYDEFDYNLAFYKSFEPICKSAGIKVAVENLVEYDPRRNRYSSLFNTPYDLTAMVKALDSSCFTACVDIGHSAQTNFAPEQFLSNMSSEVLTCLHIQDSDYWGDAHFLPYTRDFDWSKIIAALKEIGYTGDFTFEVLGYFNRLPEALYPAALDFANAVGRHLISLYNS